MTGDNAASEEQRSIHRAGAACRPRFVAIVDDELFDAHHAPDAAVGPEPWRPPTERPPAERPSTERPPTERLPTQPSPEGRSVRAPHLHPERPARLVAARAGLVEVQRRAPDAFRSLAFSDAHDDELSQLHTAAYIKQLTTLAGSMGYLDADTYHAAASVAVARRAAGGALALAEHLASGDGHGVALLRPPGHHARPDGGMGFCLLNNVALAAVRALRRCQRVAIVDWDVHHGNGTEEAFYGDERVLYASVHQAPLYPGTGAVSDVGERGGRGGRGLNVNVPLSAGANSAVYRAAFQRLLLPIVEQFAPEVILVSAGYDAHRLDPLGSMELDAAAYAWMTRSLCAVAPRARVGLFLEGGYDLDALYGSVAASADALLEAPALAASPPSEAEGAVTARFDAELERARRAQRSFWKL